MEPHNIPLATLRPGDSVRVSNSMAYHGVCPGSAYPAKAGTEWDAAGGRRGQCSCETTRVHTDYLTKDGLMRNHTTRRPPSSRARELSLLAL